MGIPIPPPLPRLGENAEDHSHCLNCFKQGECLLTITTNSCPIVFCGLNCGSRYHRCKEEEHKELCPNLQVRCWFLYDGCQKTMLRRERTNHMALCEVNNRLNRSYPQPFPTNGSNIPKPPPPPMIRSSIHEPSSNMNRSKVPHPPLPPMNITIPGNRSDGLRKHCLKCFKASVHVQTKSCPVVGCELKCGSRYRSCKENQHQELCPNMLVPCPNLNNGCQETMLRGERGNHLATVCEVMKKLAPLSHPSEKPRIPKPPPKVCGKMVMGKFVSIPPPPPGQTIIPSSPPLVNRSCIPKPPPLPVNRSNIPTKPLPANSSSRLKPSVLPLLLHQHSDPTFLHSHGLLK